MRFSILGVVNLLQILTLPLGGHAQGQGPTCSDTVPCLVGCCNKNNICGFGPEFCSPEAGCKDNCDAKAECGQYAAEGKGDCPLNVCCSKWGFCGTTEEFCNSDCQPNSQGKGCEPVQRPTCSESTDALSLPRRIGYYQLFNAYKNCGMKPEELPVEPLTHLHLAFINFDSTFKLTGEHIALVPYTALLKLTRPGLKVQIAVGGWAFNDPPTATLFSQMVSTAANRATFIESAVTYIRKWGLDGIDLDWEYPSAIDRGGNPETDAQNYVLLVAELRQAMSRENPGWELSVTLPTSYWYLKGFDIQGMEKHIDYFGMMTYDLYGMWDRDNKWTGPYLRGHTDLVDIEKGMDLLWRNGIKPGKVVFGLAFYGRSFEMESPGCSSPNGVCRFSDGGRPGQCSQTTGILIYQEIASRNNSLDTNPAVYDPTTSVKYITYGGNQWISFDDAQSFEAKKRYLSKRCLNGLMIWAIDQDTDQFDAMNGLMGDYSGLQFQRGDQDKETLKKIARGMGAYTGQDCFVTPKCYTPGMTGVNPTDPNYFCPPGFMTVVAAHAPVQTHEKFPVPDVCPTGSYHHICCPTDAMPKNCQWIVTDNPNRPCGATCGKTQFRLNMDTFLNSAGTQQCYQGTRPYCCDSTELISGCEWQSCQGPLAPGSNPSCPSHLPEFLGWRMNKPDGTRWCAHTYGSGQSTLYDRFKSPLCCPKNTGWGKCHWGNSPTDLTGRDIFTTMCIPGTCEAGSVKVGEALDPAPAIALNTRRDMNCDKMVIPPGRNPYFPLCCEPGSRLSPKWPVDPKLLWGDRAYTQPESDVAWVYDAHQANNDKDFVANPMDEGDDAYGFVMLNGPDHSLDTSFGTSYTVVRRDALIPPEKLQRRYLTTNQTELEQVFDHKMETLYVYCNYAATDGRCQKIFKLGAEDTIIGLPAHVGDGPFARVVSMNLEEDILLPEHHLQHRDTYRLENSAVYKVIIDYDFASIHPKRADEPVLMRVDYTNLLDYWDEVTDEPVSRKRSDKDAAEGRRLKRDIDPKYSQVDWLDKVKRSVGKDQMLRRRSHEIGKAVVGNVGFEFQEEPESEDSGKQLNKRWFGFFADWLRRLTTFSRSEVGELPIGFARIFTIFKASRGCPGKSFQASLQLDLETNIQLDMTYAYYLSGTLIPPSKPEMFFYFGMAPDAYLGLRLYGNAKYKATTKKKKIIDTIGYPGLAIRGIAAVGPTLDVYGQLEGFVSIKGELRAGTTINFGRAEAYWPQNADADRYMTLLELESQNKAAAPATVVPTFDVGVRIEAGLSLIVQPEANVGIKIGGGKITGGRELVNAQISGYLKTVLSFEAWGKVSGPPFVWAYSYGVYFYYNIGYKAVANVLDYVNWALGPRQAYSPDRRVDLYGPVTGEIPLTSPEKRSVKIRHDGYDLLDGPYNLDNELSADDMNAPAIHIPVHSSARTLEPHHISDGDKRNNLEDTVFTGSLFFPERMPDVANQVNTSESDLSRRQGGVPGSPGSEPPGTPEFTDPDLKCNAEGTGDVTIPELRINCQALADVSVTHKSGNVQVLGGLCRPINALTEGPPRTLTYMSNENDAADNRKATCDKISKDVCSPKSATLRAAMGATGLDYMLQCDEYPFASTEEGGTHLGTNARSATCVPSYQNEVYGGNCLKLLTGDFSSNWGQLDPKVPLDKDGKEEPREDNWVPWGEKEGPGTRWSTANQVGKNKNELVPYPTDQPPPAGLRKTQLTKGKMSWLFRRNYTFSLNTGDPAKADTWWSATGQRWVSSHTGALTGTDKILCAVNIFGQDKVYKHKTSSKGAFNGYCLEANPRKTPSRGWPYTTFHSCMITFSDPAKKKKRGGEGMYGNWHVEKIEMLGPVEDDDLS